LILADLLAFAQYVRVPWFDASFLTEPPPLARELLPEAGTARLYHSPVIMQDVGHAQLRQAEDYLFLKNSLSPSYGTSFGLREAVSYQVLKLSRADAFQKRLAAEGPGSSLLAWAGISSVITRKAGPEAWGPQSIQIVTLHRHELPLFFAKGSSRDKISAPVYTAGRIQADISVGEPRTLVFSEVFYPGWQVSIDGKKEPLILFENTFLGARIPLGEHRIEFRFVSFTFWIGLALSLVTLMGLLGLPFLVPSRRID